MRLSSNLTWNKHIEEICKSASKQTGMIYRKFYQNSSRETLLNLYISLIRPRLEYAAPVWDPSHQTLTQAVEKVQRFAFKMCLKNCQYIRRTAYRFQASNFERNNLPLLVHKINVRHALSSLSITYIVILCLYNFVMCLFLLSCLSGYMHTSKLLFVYP